MIPYNCRIYLILSNILFLHKVQPLTITTTDNKIIHSNSLESKSNIQQSLKHKQKPYKNQFNSNKECTHRCPEPKEDLDLDRREAMFATLGSIWSITTGISSPSNSIYGEDAKIQVPDMLGGMNDRVNQQCLVESLGNRECLVYLDPEKKLYEGPDNQSLLTQLEDSIIALNSLPDLITTKKWSKVSNVLTGPMGLLIGTMRKLSDGGGDDDDDVLVKKVKEDLYGINGAIERKDMEKALVWQGRAVDDLNEFIS